jgi:hypothetical protein
MIGRRLFGCLLPVLALQGCVANAPRQETSVSREALAERISLAERQEASGDIARALFHWQVAAALAPGDPGVADNIRRLERQQDLDARRYREEAQRHLARHRTRDARRALLRVLVANPGDSQAMEQLRNLEQDRTGRQLRAKVSRSKDQIYQADDTPRRLDIKQATAMVDKHLDRAQGEFKNGRYDKALGAVEEAEQAAEGHPALLKRIQYARKGYAEWLYGSGIRLAGSDPQQALAYLRQTLRFQPEHAKAAVRIRRLSPN